jgi:hypothetical protein
MDKQTRAPDEHERKIFDTFTDEQKINFMNKCMDETMIMAFKHQAMIAEDKVKKVKLALIKSMEEEMRLSDELDILRLDNLKWMNQIISKRDSEESKACINKINGRGNEVE